MDNIQQAKNKVIEEIEGRKSKSVISGFIMLLIFGGLGFYLFSLDPWIEVIGYFTKMMGVGALVMGVTFCISGFTETAKANKEIEEIKKMSDNEFKAYVRMNKIKLGVAVIKVIAKLIGG